MALVVTNFRTLHMLSEWNEKKSASGMGNAKVRNGPGAYDLRIYLRAYALAAP